MYRKAGFSLLRANVARSAAVRPIAPSSFARSFNTSKRILNQNDGSKKPETELKETETSDIPEATEPVSFLENQSVLESSAQEEIIESEKNGEAYDELHVQEEFENDDLKKECEGSEGQVDAEEYETAEAQEDEVPWYMRGDEASELDNPIFKAEVPEIPEGAPDAIEPMLTHCAQELGLDDIKVFDIRNREDLPASLYVDFMIMMSGKSEKHIQSAVEDIARYIKEHFKAVPHIEGLMKANSMKRNKRRTKKNLRNGGLIDNEFGVGPNSWVMIDTNLDGTMIHVLTPERRRRVNLEYMWCDPKDREQYEPVTEFQPVLDVDDIFFGLQRRNYSTRVQTDLGDTAIQQFQLGDVEGLNKSVLEIQQGEKSVEVLQKVIDYISELPISKAIADLQDPENKYIKFFTSFIPSIPTVEHFEKRYQLYSTLHKILPDVYPIETLTQVLLHQAAAGEVIKEQHYKAYISDLISTTQFGHDSVTSRDELNEIFKVKFLSLKRVLRVISNQGIIKVDNEFISDMLLLSSQYIDSKSIDPVPASRYFKIILDLYQDHKFDRNVLYIALSTLARANDKDFWKYWEELRTYNTDLKEVIYDERPWNVLLKVIAEVPNGRLLDDFILEQAPLMIAGEVVLDDEMKMDLLSIIQKHGGNVEIYSDLVKYVMNSH